VRFVAREIDAIGVTSRIRILALVDTESVRTEPALVTISVAFTAVLGVDHEINAVVPTQSEPVTAGVDATSSRTVLPGSTGIVALATVQDTTLKTDA
jgi:hypothetical protein